MNHTTENLVAALHVLANDIQSDDGVANAVIKKAAMRLTKQCEKLNVLRNRISQNNLEIEQTCGKALGYPWYKDDQKNFPGATEKDGVCVGEHVAETIVAELANRYTEALARIKRLEEAGDEMFKWSERVGQEYWTKAKEVK